VLPAGQPTLPELQRLTNSNRGDESRLRRECLGRLAAAHKNIRHYPPHEFDADGRPDTRPKCSLLGSFAQMGPIADGGQQQMRITQQFWSEVSEDMEAHGPIDGVWLGRRDRFCAVSLVKRFAWSAYFAPKFGPSAGDADFPDIDTICAARWLADAGIDRRQTYAVDHSQYWSGHWLRWKSPDEGRPDNADEYEKCPRDDTWRQILQARHDHGAPSAYYAVLMLDGDDLNELMRTADDGQLLVLTRTISQFAQQHVRRTVEDEHIGKLIYAGGDDVLALLPASKALAAAKDLADLYTKSLTAAGFRDHNGQPPTCSAGLAIAHYKANLREVLDAARAAEREAKAAGKDRLTLAVLRRSGEHTSVSCPWPQVEQMSALVGQFPANSDRWAYRLRGELESSLPDIGPLLQAEFERSLQHAEGCTDGFRAGVRRLWQDVQGASGLGRAREFIHLVQSASFLARGGKE
jgi:CRISPR-associated protein Cmr2